MSRIVLFISLFLLSGCAAQWSAPKEDGTPKYPIMFCSTSLFSDIHEVDKLLPENCYAMAIMPQERNIDDSLTFFNIKKSLNYSEKNKYEIWEEIDGRDCENLQDLNEVYNMDIFCLRNHTQCMVVEDSKICRMVDLT